MLASTYSEHQEATEEQSYQGTLGKEISSQKLAQRDSSTAGRRWRRRLKTEPDGEK